MTKPLPGAMAAISRGMEPPSYMTSGVSSFRDGHPLRPGFTRAVYADLASQETAAA